MAKPDQHGLRTLDAALSGGGLATSRQPVGALKRARSKRDARTAAKPPARSSKIEILRAPAWNTPWLVHGFSTRGGGFSTVFRGRDLNLGFSSHDPRGIVERNRERFFAEMEVCEVSAGKSASRNIAAEKTGAGKMKLVALKQIHSDIIHVIETLPPQPLTGDGAITAAAGLLLSIQTADCVPILLLDAKRKCVGTFHAGWRGAARRIVEKGVGMMRLAFGCDPKDIRAAIGPCIGQCCYAVGEEVIDDFHSQFAYAPALFREVFDDDPVKRKYPLLFLTARAPGHSNLGPQIHLDLAAANRRQLLDAGVPAKNIWSADLCTGCNTDRLFSHRKEDGFTGRMMAVIGIKKRS